MDQTTRKSLPKALEYVLLRLISALLLLLPFFVRARFMEQFARVLFSLSKRYRNLVQDHLRLAFPEENSVWIQQMSVRNARSMGRLFAELIQTPSITPAFFARHFVIENEDLQREIFSRGGMAILGHLGNWEWHGLVGARLAGRPIYTIVKRHTNFWSNRYAETSRNLAGMRLIYVDQNPFEIVRLLRRGEFVAFTSDQDARQHGSFFPFFGKPASTFMGPAIIARTTSVPAYFVWSYRKDGKVVFAAEKLQEPSVARENLELWEDEFTRIWLARLERAIREHPADYLWAHNRWKSQPVPTGQGGPSSD
ncbi:MAG: lysophospholipid acyltransferase family protein [Spirochaetales bacterium]|nr:lysophospholipid acyltransferase family protein [Spirochaetales bacterium]